MQDFKHVSTVTLENQPNFRDLGGLPAFGSARTRRGLLFRSGALHKLSDADIARLAGLGLRHIVDFRSERERSERPDKAIPTVERISHLPIVDAIHEQVLVHFDNNDSVSLNNILVRDYRRMINDHHLAFRDFFTLLTREPVLPMAFHCAMGKDRTGLASYLLLHALGVEEPVNRSEYIATNRYLEDYVRKLIAGLDAEGKPGHILKPLLQVRLEYLDAALDEITVRFGGLEAYLECQLKADVEMLRALYLEPS
jgi:protein-tyrosine phosphatase